MFLEIAASLVSCEGISQPAREHWPGGRELCKPRPVVIFLAASAQTYPVSGVWVERDDHFPGSTAGACLILKKLGVDAALAQPFPTLMIFSKSQRFAMRGDHLAETSIKSVKTATDGSFQISESLGKRSLPFAKKHSFILNVIDPTTISITEGPISSKFFKCSSMSPPL
jgi:hypothetical protein